MNLFSVLCNVLSHLWVYNKKTSNKQIGKQFDSFERAEEEDDDDDLDETPGFCSI